jgi:hypothetical protein
MGALGLLDDCLDVAQRLAGHFSTMPPVPAAVVDPLVQVGLAP